MAADCEIEAGPGVLCGVAAIGRCADCGRAFCLSHRALRSQPPGGYYTNLCVGCLYAREARIPPSPEHVAFLALRDAREQLRRAEIPSERIVDLQYDYVMRRWRGSGTVPRVIEEYRGWVLGEVLWTSGRERHKMLTAQLDVDHHRNGGLVQIRREAEFGLTLQPYPQFGHIDAVQASEALASCVRCHRVDDLRGNLH